MNERDWLFLNHVLRAIAEIQSFTTDGRSGFMADRNSVWFRLGLRKSLVRRNQQAPCHKNEPSALGLIIHGAVAAETWSLPCVPDIG